MLLVEGVSVTDGVLQRKGLLVMLPLHTAMPIYGLRTGCQETPTVRVRQPRHAVYLGTDDGRSEGFSRRIHLLYRREEG